MRGETASATGPNTGTIRRFSARYWRTTTPRPTPLPTADRRRFRRAAALRRAVRRPPPSYAGRGGPEDLARGLREGAGGAYHGSRKQRKPLSRLGPCSCNRARWRRLRSDCSVHPITWPRQTLCGPSVRTPGRSPELTGTLAHCGLHRPHRVIIRAPRLRPSPLTEPKAAPMPRPILLRRPGVRRVPAKRDATIARRHPPIHRRRGVRLGWRTGGAMSAARNTGVEVSPVQFRRSHCWRPCEARLAFFRIDVIISIICRRNLCEIDKPETVN